MNSLAALLLAYVVGCISFAALVARSRGLDIRAHGSGNPGATNVGRVLGRGWGRLVLALDILKGLLPVLFLSAWPGWVDGSGKTPVAAAVVLGHIAPFYAPLRGGKGVATFLGACLGLDVPLTLLALALHFLVRRVSGYVSLASVVMACAFPGLQLLARACGQGDVVNTQGTLLLAALALMITLRHAANLGRIRAGTEARHAPSRSHAARDGVRAVTPEPQERRKH